MPFLLPYSGQHGLEAPQRQPAKETGSTLQRCTPPDKRRRPAAAMTIKLLADAGPAYPVDGRQPVMERGACAPSASPQAPPATAALTIRRTMSLLPQGGPA
jgi:hypothetical protein